MPTISGIAFYAKVQAPSARYQKEGSNDVLDYEYSVDLLVDAATQKAFYKKFSSQKGKTAEPLTPQEFEKKYGLNPETTDVKANGDGEYTVVKLKTGNAYKDYKTGEVLMLPKPKVLFKNDQTGKLEEDTTTLVGNGSKVMVQFNEYENKKWKTVSAKLAALRVDELVPYGGGGDYSELGDIDESSFSNEAPDFSEDSLETEAAQDDDDDFSFS